MPGPIYLVLDNSLIQAFKHRQTNAKRAVDALAFETFCTFVRDWSDRESHLALSPMAIFEHTGRRPPASVAEVEHIGSGRLSETLADLNTFGRNRLLKGLGDIDLLQICDISRQYQQKLDYVLVGQTLDRDLAETLSQRHA